MRLVFRADASRQIGAGHVMRVTTIAEEAIGRGHECHFVGKISDLAWVEKHVQNLGFKSFIREIDVINSEFQNSVLILDSRPMHYRKLEPLDKIKPPRINPSHLFE
jgi:spore coat polysaccharide biosynthesis predicted glycosyltransferase SpsG